MDWQLAITRNREALLTIVIALMNSLGLVKGGTLTTLPFHLYRKALLILRPAESALRRLIVIAAHDMHIRGIKLRQTRAAHDAAHFPRAIAFAPSFNLIEPLKTFGAETPDFSSFGAFTDNPATGFRIPAASLGRRLLALQHALDSIPKQARRLARWYAARDLALQLRKPHRLSPMRPGLPPGWRRRPTQEVETILNECHGLAHYSLERRDSS